MELLGSGEFVGWIKIMAFQSNFHVVAVVLREASVIGESSCHGVEGLVFNYF